MKKRIVSIMMVLVMLFGLIGCNGSGEESKTESSKTEESKTETSKAESSKEDETAEKGAIVDGVYRYNETVTVEAIAMYRPDYQTDPADKWVFKWAEDKMNISFDVSGIPESNLNEQVSLLFASNELPDVLLTVGMNLANQSKYGDEEGQLVAINKYMTEENMPNLTSLLKEVPEVAVMASTAEGNMYAMPELYMDPSVYPTSCNAPIYYRQDWFKAVGYEEPPTDVYEMLEALRKIKAEDPGNVGEGLVPWGGSVNSGAVLVPFYNAFGFYGWGGELIEVIGGDYLHGGELVATGLTDNYYAYLQFVNTLYEEELMEIDYFTLDYAQATAKNMEGKYATLPSFVMDTACTDIMEWTGLKPMTSEYNDVQIVPGYMYGGVATLMSICDGASDEAIEACLRFADVHYDPELKWTMLYGPQEGDDLYGVLEGPTWEWRTEANGAVKPMTLGIYGVDSQFENWVDYLEAISLCSFSGSAPDRRPDDANWYEFDANNPKQRAAAEYVSAIGDYLVPVYTGGVFSGEEANQVADYKTSLSEYFNSETAKFITGVRELNDTEWEAFKAELIARGYEDLYNLELEYYNAVYGNN